MSLNRSIAPAFNQVDSVSFLAVKFQELDNGIPVHIIHGGSQDIVKIDFVFDAGVYFQDKALLSSTTNKLMKEGTASYSAFEVSEGIDKYGAFLELEHSFDSATVTLYTLTKHLEKVIPYLKEVILEPSFSQEELSIYVENSKEKFRINLEKVSYVARKKFSSLLYGMEGAYASDVSESDYDNLSRNELIEFHKKHYNLANAKIIVSGKVEDAVVNALNKNFGSSPISEKGENLNKIVGKNAEKTIHLPKEGALQSAIRIGRVFPNKLDPDYFGLKVLNTVLGGYFGSRLMSNIREDKGYTYGIGSGLVSMVNSGYFFISTEVQAASTQEALNEIYKEIELLRAELIPSEELDLVKNYMLGQMLTSCDGPFRMAGLFEQVNGYGLTLDYYNEYINVIKKITPEELQSLGVKYFNREDLKEVVVGNI